MLSAAWVEYRSDNIEHARGNLENQSVNKTMYAVKNYALHIVNNWVSPQLSISLYLLHNDKHNRSANNGSCVWEVITTIIYSTVVQICRSIITKKHSRTWAFEENHYVDDSRMMDVVSNKGSYEASVCLMFIVLRWMHFLERMAIFSVAPQNRVSEENF